MSGKLFSYSYINGLSESGKQNAVPYFVTFKLKIQIFYRPLPPATKNIYLFRNSEISI